MLSLLRSRLKSVSRILGLILVQVAIEAMVSKRAIPQITRKGLDEPANNAEEDRAGRLCPRFHQRTPAIQDRQKGRLRV